MGVKAEWTESGCCEKTPPNRNERHDLVVLVFSTFFLYFYVDPYSSAPITLLHNVAHVL